LCYSRTSVHPSHL